LEFSLGQTTTAAFVEVLEDSGETVEFPAANAATLSVWQKTDQVGTDGGKNIHVECVSNAGVVSEADVDLDAVATTTAVATGLTGFHLPRQIVSTEVLVADEVLVGLHDKSKVYGVIKVGCFQAAQSRYQVPAGRRAFLVCVDALGPHTNPSTYQITCTHKGYTSAVVWNKGNIVSGAWDHQDFFWELAEGSEIKFDVKKDADANHGTFTLRYKIIEAADAM
jgi:hypothetical protein